MRVAVGDRVGRCDRRLAPLSLVALCLRSDSVLSDFFLPVRLLMEN